MSVLVASAARTTSNNSGALVLAHAERLKAASLLLDVTAAATLVGDTLDVYVQTSVDGSTWDDLAHFTQVLGNGGAKKFLAYWQRDLAPTSALHAPVDASMAAGVNQGPVGGSLRVKWVVVGTGSFTFSVSGSLTFDLR